MDYPLPEDVESAMMAGDFSLARSLIHSHQRPENLPKAMADRFDMAAHEMEIIKSCYNISLEEGDRLLLEAYPETYVKGKVYDYVIQGELDWRYIDGEVMLEKRSVENAAKRVPGLVPPAASDDNADSDLQIRDENVEYMKSHDERKARIHIRSRLKVKGHVGEKVHVNMPIVRNAESISDIVLHDHSESMVSVDDEDALMRTAVFEKKLEEGDEFFLDFSYVITAHKRNIEAKGDVIDTEAFAEYLKEEGPHIVFTPFLKEIVKEIVGDRTDPADKARAIYEWITTYIRYSYVREYAAIRNIPEYAIANQKGDCGIQALTFITLCRIAGVPARWQSGWYTTPEGVFCHDWAEFYLPSYGWCFADCSFGGGAYNMGKMERWQHYFGSDDCLRTPCNNACCRTLTGKKRYAADPVDSQRGEVETGKSLPREDIEWSAETLEFEYL